MAKPDIFWTDAHQAAERLNNAVVLYDEQPVYVETISGAGEYEDGIPRATVRQCADKGAGRSSKKLDSPKFHRFRELPKIGWMNADMSGVGAVWLSRRAIRTRTHGLTTTNTSVRKFVNDPERGDNFYLGAPGGSGYGFSHAMFDKGFVDAHNGKFPTLARVLSSIQEGTAIAFSRKFCVAMDRAGVRWLYRNEEKIGLFVGVDTLMMLAKFAFFREEIMEDSKFTISNIREF